MVCTACTCRILSTDNIGDIIQQKYLDFIEENWTNLKDMFQDIPSSDDSNESTYLYLKIHRDTLDISFSDLGDGQGDRESQSEYWITHMPVDRDTTKKELLEHRADENSSYYEDTNEHLAFNGWTIPLVNIAGVIVHNDGSAKISFKTQGVFSKVLTEKISRECFQIMEDQIRGKMIVIPELYA